MHSPRDEHLKDLFCARSHCFPQQGVQHLCYLPWRRARSYGTSARQASQNKANHGKLLEGPGLPGHANSKSGRLSSFCRTIPFELFDGVTLATRLRASWGIWSSHALDIWTQSLSTSLDRFTIKTPGMMVIPKSRCLRSHKNMLISPFYMVPVVGSGPFGLTFLSTKSCQSLPSSSENQRDTAPVATFSTINF